MRWCGGASVVSQSWSKGQRWVSNAARIYLHLGGASADARSVPALRRATYAFVDNAVEEEGDQPRWVLKGGPAPAGLSPRGRRPPAQGAPVGALGRLRGVLVRVGDASPRRRRLHPPSSRPPAPASRMRRNSGSMDSTRSPPRGPAPRLRPQAQGLHQVVDSLPCLAFSIPLNLDRPSATVGLNPTYLGGQGLGIGLD